MCDFIPMLDPFQAQGDLRKAVWLLAESHGTVCSPNLSRRLDLLRRMVESPGIRELAQLKIDEMQS